MDIPNPNIFIGDQTIDLRPRVDCVSQPPGHAHESDSEGQPKFSSLMETPDSSYGGDRCNE